MHSRHITFDESVMFKLKENSSNSADSKAERSKKMKIISTYQPSRGKAVKEDRVIAVVDTSY